MRVVIHEQLDVTDEQRVQIANLLDGKVTRRQAKRDEMKEWIWQQGLDWMIALQDEHAVLLLNEGETPADDLIGDVDLEDLL